MAAQYVYPVTIHLAAAHTIRNRSRRTVKRMIIENCQRTSPCFHPLPPSAVASAQTGAYLRRSRRNLGEAEREDLGVILAAALT
jgi:hypothetical protein